MKRMRKTQTRHGNPARRRLEFDVICDQVRRRKGALIERLERNTRAIDGHQLYTGTLDGNGYPRMTFRYKGQHVTIHAMRVFLILKTCAPIPRGHEAAHTNECKHRSCVLHVEAQHFKINARTNGPHKDIPF